MDLYLLIPAAYMITQALVIDCTSMTDIIWYKYIPFVLGIALALVATGIIT